MTGVQQVTIGEDEAEPLAPQAGDESENDLS